LELNSFHHFGRVDESQKRICKYAQYTYVEWMMKSVTGISKYTQAQLYYGTKHRCYGWSHDTFTEL